MATIHTDETTQSDLKAFCKKNGITQGEFVKFSLAYFRKSGVNPADSPESVKEELAKIDKRISQVIAFQKTFEDKKLNPLLIDMIEVLARLKQSPHIITAKDIADQLKPFFRVQTVGILGVDYKDKKELDEAFNLSTLEATLDVMLEHIATVENQNGVIINGLMGDETFRKAYEDYMLRSIEKKNNG